MIIKTKTKTETASPVEIKSNFNGIFFKIQSPKLGEIKACTYSSSPWDEGKQAVCVNVDGRGFSYLPIEKEVFQKALNHHLKEKEKREEKERKENEKKENQEWNWANSVSPKGRKPVTTYPGSSGYLDKWQVESGETYSPDYREASRGEIAPCGYGREFFFVKDSFFQENESEEEKEKKGEQRRKEIEQERILNQKKAESKAFEEAKKTGKEVLIESFSTGCDSEEEECNLDIISRFALPDGKVKTFRVHTF